MRTLALLILAGAFLSGCPKNEDSTAKPVSQDAPPTEATAEMPADKSKAPGKDGSYAFAIKLEPGLVKYRVEFGTRTGGSEKVLHRAGDILCGDAHMARTEGTI